ncbi:M48 family metalloprotease [Selenomonas sp. AB3002]|uniref:M48 family metalloprotease n=1 Tax=Selenomonas sp. AB3002 TaxID=1392502 RepID=UPI00296E47A4
MEKGDYALKADSLPFLWSINDSNDFNAACYPTNYISINRALVRGLQCDRDELAAVLAHEMTHGLRQHSAHNYAKAVASTMAWPSSIWMQALWTGTSSTRW